MQHCIFYFFLLSKKKLSKCTGCIHLVYALANLSKKIYHLVINYLLSNPDLSNQPYRDINHLCVDMFYSSLNKAGNSLYRNILVDKLKYQECFMVMAICKLYELWNRALYKNIANIKFKTKIYDYCSLPKWYLITKLILSKNKEYVMVNFFTA